MCVCVCVLCVRVRVCVCVLCVCVCVCVCDLGSEFISLLVTISHMYVTYFNQFIVRMVCNF